MAKYRYRYILPDAKEPYGPISGLTLYPGNKVGPMTNLLIRVRIPEDIKLTKRSYAYYSVTDDHRTIEELGYDVLVKFDSKWKIQNSLMGKTFYEMIKELKKGGYEELGLYGWLTRLEYMKTLGYIRKINNACDKILQI